MNPYRTPGDPGEDMPRPIERKFQVNLFVQGGNERGLDTRETLAQQFHDWLEEQAVGCQAFAFNNCNVIAVEVKPLDEDGDPLPEKA